MNDKIEGLLAEGRAMLASGRPRDAVFVFERILLLAPQDADARAGLDAAHAATAEDQRAAEERLARDVPDRVSAARGWFSLRRTEADADAALPTRSPSGRSRLLLGVACAALFVALGAAVAGNWNGLMRRLAQAPVPHESSISLAPAPRADEQTIATARRLLADGEPARAAALLDSVHPQQPSYPLARQLRGQAERALRQPGSRP